MFTQLKNVSVSASGKYLLRLQIISLFSIIEIIKSPNDEILQTSDLLSLLWKNAVYLLWVFFSLLVFFSEATHHTKYNTMQSQ